MEGPIFCTVIDGKIAVEVQSGTPGAWYRCGAWYVFEKDFERANKPGKENENGKY